MGIANISLETRKLIDEQLIQIARINCKIGRDTRVDERIEYLRQIRVHLNEIKRLDQGFYEEIIPDKNERN